MLSALGANEEASHTIADARTGRDLPFLAYFRATTMEHSHPFNSISSIALEILLNPSKPWLYKCAVDSSHMLRAFKEWGALHREAHIYILNGNRAESIDDFYDEASRVFSLPSYFGRNLNALSECLADGDVISGDPLILLIPSANRILRKAQPETLDGVLAVLKNVAYEWAVPIRDAEQWDREAVSFHVIFNFEDVEKRQALISLPEFPM